LNRGVWHRFLASQVLINDCVLVVPKNFEDSCSFFESDTWFERNDLIAGSMQQGNTRIESGFLAAIPPITAIDQNRVKQMPLTYKLYQNYPNPFNPSTTIQFDIPKLSKVTLKIVDMLGREVATLVDDKLQPGEHKVIFDTGKLPSGVYFYRLQAEDFSATKKLMLLK
jgi:hypothetical protein